MSPDLGIAAPSAPGSDDRLAAGMSFEEPGDGKAKSSLLLVEDDDALRRMLLWELSERGYRVLAVGSCQQARAEIAIQNFELALFDMGLPDGDGAELAAELLEQRPALRIVLCSGRPRALDSAPIPPKVLARLTKPVSAKRLDSLYRGRE